MTLLEYLRLAAERGTLVVSDDPIPDPTTLQPGDVYESPSGKRFVVVSKGEGMFQWCDAPAAEPFETLYTVVINGQRHEIGQETRRCAVEGCGRDSTWAVWGDGELWGLCNDHYRPRSVAYITAIDAPKSETKEET